MRITLLLAAAAVLSAVQDLSDRGAMAPGSSFSARSLPIQARPAEPPASEVREGDIAPDFAYQGVDARWRRLRDLVTDTPALLVFGANEATLRIIEGEREALMDLGVLPVAVVGSRIGAARAQVNRHGLRYTVLADPQGVIAAQFNAMDPATGRQLPAWFVLDRQRRVRGLGRKGLPLRGYAELAAEALGLPPRSATVPAAR
jgi:peroxiredoxin